MSRTSRAPCRACILRQKSGLSKSPARFEENLAHLPLEPHEGEEFLREEVAVPDVEPRFRCELLVQVPGPRHVAEVAVRQGAELVVIVKRHAAVPGNAEVLQQEVAAEPW